MDKITIKKVRSTIKKSANQKKTMKALGLNKMNQIVEKEATPQILGMVRKVSHLVAINKETKK